MQICRYMDGGGKEGLREGGGGGWRCVMGWWCSVVVGFILLLKSAESWDVIFYIGSSYSGVRPGLFPSDARLQTICWYRRSAPLFIDHRVQTKDSYFDPLILLKRRKKKRKCVTKVGSVCGDRPIFPSAFYFFLPHLSLS